MHATVENQEHNQNIHTYSHKAISVHKGKRKGFRAAIQF